MSCGINRHTGRPLEGWPHVRQSLGVIMSTRWAQRVLMRAFGFGGLALLGQSLTPAALMRWFMALVLAISPRKAANLANIDLGEPRFRITSISFPSNRNSASQLQQGQFGLLITGEFMPNALEGDFAVASQQKFFI